MYDQDVAERTVRIEEKLDTALRMLKSHDHLLYGNGKDGIVVEVDRLKMLVKYGGSLLSAVLAVIVAWVKWK